jgi:integrase
VRTRRASRRPDSFSAVADEWLKRDQVHKRSAAEVKRVIERDVKPAWDGRLIATLSRRDVIDLIDGVVDRGAVTMARRLHAHLHRLFRWSVGRGILAVNPMTDLPKPGKAVKRDRVLVDAELAAVWKAADKVGWPFGPPVQLLILTAARRDEIGALCRSEIDGATIELSGERTKNGEPHTIPLSTTAAQLIESLPRIGPGDLVFTTNGKTAVSGWSKAKSSLDDAATKLYGRALPAWRLHDLRRTTATGMQRIGISLQVVEAILGHVGGSRAGVAGVYQRHSFDVEKRIALEAWAHEVERIVSGKQAAIVAMVRR